MAFDQVVQKIDTLTEALDALCQPYLVAVDQGHGVHIVEEREGVEGLKRLLFLTLTWALAQVGEEAGPLALRELADQLHQGIETCVVEPCGEEET